MNRAKRKNKINQIKKRTRLLKIQRHWRKLTYNWQYYPTLRLKGAWLELAGFEVGDKVQIEVYHNQLILTNLANETPCSYEDRTNQRTLEYPEPVELLWLGGE